jgi:hypothetical protein
MRSRFDLPNFAAWLRAGGEPGALFVPDVLWAEAILTPVSDPSEAAAAHLRKFLLVEEAIG